MLKTFLNKLEDPKILLLGPNIKALKFWGLLLPEKPIKKYFYYFLHCFVVVFTGTEVANIWLVKSDINILLNNVKIAIVSTVSVAKLIAFVYWQDHWKKIIDYVTNADLIQRNDSISIKKSVISKYTKYCRRITYFYWILMFVTVFIVFALPVYKFLSSKTYRINVKNGTEHYMEAVNSWVPFDKTTLSGYVLLYTYQFFSSVYGTGWISSFDTVAISIMVFFKGELELIKIESGRIFGTESFSIEKKTVVKMLKDCHRRYDDLVKYARLFDSCLSPIMLLYVIVCSVMLCVTAYQVNTETNAVQRLLYAEFLIFGISQLFMYCWHSNEVYYMSKDLLMGPYESIWWTREVSEQKEIHMLVGQFKKTIVFSAGPFTHLTVATFINILKGAYSYYTLLSQAQEDQA